MSTRTLDATPAPVRNKPRVLRTARTAAASSLVLLLAALAGCAPQAPGGDTAEETVTFGVSVPTMNASWVELAVAEDRGYFAAEGINVEPQFLKSSGGVLQSMAVGRTDIGGPTPEAVLPAVEKGQHLKMVYQWTRGPVQSLAVPAGSSIRSFSDVRGTTIGVSELASGAKILADASVTSAGLDPEKDVTYLPVGVGIAAWDALRRGRVDALMLWDSEYAAMENAGAKLRYIRGRGMDDLFSTTFVAGQDWLKDHPGQTKGFGRAWAKASTWAGQHPAEAIRTMWRLYPESRTSTNEASLLKDQLNVFKQRHAVVTMGDPQSHRTWGRYAPEAVQQWADLAGRAGLLKHPLDAADIYTNRYAKAYNDFTASDLKRAGKGGKEK